MTHYLTLSLAALLASSLTSQTASGDPQPPALDAAELLERAVSAIAPPEEFDQMKSLQFRGKSKSLTVESDEELGGAHTDMLMLFPGEIPDELFMHSIFKQSPENVFIRTLAGDRSFAGQVGNLPEELHKDFVRYASTKLLTILRYRKSPHLMAESSGSEKIGETTVDLVQITLFGHKSVLEIERDSGRVLAVRFESSEIQEGVGKKIVRRAYSDTRSVHGFLIPFLQEVTVGDEPYSLWQLDEVIVNGEYDTSIFDLSESVPPLD